MACPLCLPIHGGYEEDHDQEGDEGIKRLNEEEKQMQRLNGDGDDGDGDGDGDGHLKEVFDAFDVNRDGIVTVEELCEWMERLGLHITEDGMRDMVKKTCGHEGGRLRFEEFRTFADTLQSEKARLPRTNLRYDDNDNDNDDDGTTDRTYPKEKIEPTNHASTDGSKKIDKDVKRKDYGVIINEDGDKSQDQDDDEDDEDIREAFRVFDKNGDGLISPSDLRSTLSGLGMLSSSTSFRRIHSMIRRVDTDHDGYVSLPEFKSMIKINK